MTLVKQRALCLLIAVVLWTAAPLMACMPGAGARSASDCCQHMAMQDCGQPMMGSSCCEVAPSHGNLAVVTAYTLQHGPQSATLVSETWLPLMTDPHAAQAAFGETPPPDPSPGGLSVLRI